MKTTNRYYSITLISIKFLWGCVDILTNLRAISHKHPGPELSVNAFFPINSIVLPKVRQVRGLSPRLLSNFYSMKTFCLPRIPRESKVFFFSLRKVPTNLGVTDARPCNETMNTNQMWPWKTCYMIHPAFSGFEEFWSWHHTMRYLIFGRTGPRFLIR